MRIASRNGVAGAGGCGLHAHPRRSSAQRGNPDALAPVRIQDLAYGDVLFHYWADEDSGLEALTRLEAYEHWNLMPHHAGRRRSARPRGCICSSACTTRPARVFEKAAQRPRAPGGTQPRPGSTSDRSRYQRGLYDRSEQALQRIQGTLAPELEGERNNLMVNALMYQGRYDEAIARLTSWRGPRDWMAFAQFNLGVALVRAGRLAQAGPILTARGQYQAEAEG